MNREELKNKIDELIEACKNGDVIVENGTADEAVSSLINFKTQLEYKEEN